MSEIAPSAAFADQLQIFRQRADRALLDFIAPLPFNDGNMVAAMRHGALLGGKRLRPFLVYTTGQMFGVFAEQPGRAGGGGGMHPRLLADP